MNPILLNFLRNHRHETDIRSTSPSRLDVAPHPSSFNHICSKRNALFRHAIIPSSLMRIRLWSNKWALMRCTRVVGFCSNQEVLAKARSSLSNTIPPDLLPRHVNLCLTKPKSTNLHSSTMSRKALISDSLLGTPPSFSWPLSISLKSPTQIHVTQNF